MNAGDRWHRSVIEEEKEKLKQRKFGGSFGCQLPEGPVTCVTVAVKARVNLHVAQGAKLSLGPTTRTFPKLQGNKSHFLSLVDDAN